MTTGMQAKLGPIGGLWFEGVTSLLGFIPSSGSGKIPAVLSHKLLSSGTPEFRDMVVTYKMRFYIHFTGSCGGVSELKEFSSKVHRKNLGQYVR
jgi:hypothetical protein